MTESQRARISGLRAEGMSYAGIAIALGLSENTVKSFCRRNGLGGNVSASSSDGIHCRNCGVLLVHTLGTKRKKFCSNKCRMAWWNAYPEVVQRKTVCMFTCGLCGIQFQSYGNRQRKYCSRACYGKSKVAETRQAVRHE